MIHDNVALTVSQDEATRAEDEAKRRLLSLKKLSLVVDLDQTVIQATVDPTVAEWQKDPENPNHDAVKDVRAFQLTEEGPGGNGCWYYIKLRPGLKEFLDNVSKLYELHIYTMGTRSYAKHISRIIDPECRIFGNRILSRSENGSFTVKSLQRLFPVDTKMVVIIDDRGDVWNWIPNLIKVNPYDFFIGIGDINSSFLPKRPESPKVPRVAPASTPDPNNDIAESVIKDSADSKVNGTGTEASQSEESSQQESIQSSVSDVSALEQLVSMGGGDDPTLLREQTASQDKTITTQVADRPLLQKQKQLEAEEAALDTASQDKDADGNPVACSDSASESDKPRHNLLHDDDRELQYLEEALRKVHTQYYDICPRELTDLQGGRVAQLRVAQTNRQSLPASRDMAMVPDIKVLLPQVKRTVLAGVVIVFSGVVPLGADIQISEPALQAKAYGARVEERVSRKITHVVAAKPRTAKTKQAELRGKKVVNPRWLYDSITRWRKQEELPYIMKYDGSDTSQSKSEDSDDILSDSEDDMGSSFDTEEDDPQTSTARTKPSLTVNTNDDETFSDTEGLIPITAMDDKSPIGGTNEDWDSMKAEMAAYLGNDAEDSGSEASGIASVESNKSTDSRLNIRGKKRLRPDPGDSESEDGSPEAKKRGTTLRQTVVAEKKVSGLPTPDITAGEETIGKPDNDDDKADGDGQEGDGWSEFEDDLEAEMERAANEEADS
jgi:RNA polymerase II subunit A-like phosphatase